MYRLLSEIAAYLKDLSRSSLRAWNDFWFAPADPTALGLMRVVVGVLMFWDLAALGPDLHEYLGSVGWIGPEATLRGSILAARRIACCHQWHQGGADPVPERRQS